MKKFSTLIIFLMTTIRIVMAQQGENLVENGTFEQGNVGFKSDFRFSPDESFDDLLVKGCYTVMDNFPYQVSRFLNHFKTNRGGYDSLSNSIVIWQTKASTKSAASTGDFLAVNVNVSGKIWYDSITIKPNTSYSFSCIVANIYYKPPQSVTIGFENNLSHNNLACPGDMKLCVNGEQVSEVLKLSYQNDWSTLSGTFTSGPDQSGIEISIHDQPWSQIKLTTVWAGAVHYVAVDSIVFKEIQPVKINPSVKKDTTAQTVTVGTDFKKDISIDEIKIDQKLQLSHIYFERSKYNLLMTSFPELNDLAAFMKKHPTVRIRLEGHTDNQGDSEINAELSENRVKEVKKYLMEKGIAKNRIEWIGYGEQRPAYSNANETLRSKNRRVEVVIISK
jgi:outer membrane protein OmpA-like peptidoglycan-associated protein